LTAIDTTTIAPPEVKRDRWGRYIVTNPDGKPTAHTRATTVASTIEDRYNLEKWQQRMVAAGLANRPDLAALAASHHPTDDKKTYNKLCNDAIEAAKASAGANTGTALHKMTEDIDRGTKAVADFPAQYHGHLIKYTETLSTNNITVHPGCIEAVLIEDNYTVCGTADRVVTLPDGRNLIADLKTGATVHFSWLAISIQLAIYANHTAMWDTETQQRKPRIDVDTDHALVIHMPSSADPPTCELHLIDIKQGWRHYETAMEVRSARNGADGLAERYLFSDATPAATVEQTTATIRARLERAVTLDGALVVMANRWPDSVPQPLPADLTAEQVGAMDRLLSNIESLHSLPL